MRRRYSLAVILMLGPILMLGVTTPPYRQPAPFNYPGPTPTSAETRAAIHTVERCATVQGLIATVVHAIEHHWKPLAWSQKQTLRVAAACYDGGHTQWRSGTTEGQWESDIGYFVSGIEGYSGPDGENVAKTIAAVVRGYPTIQKDYRAVKRDWPGLKLP